MKWFVFVLFMQPSDGFYVFMEPTFADEDECIGSITDPNQIPMYVESIFEHYKRPIEIKGVTCLNQNELKQILIKTMPKDGVEV